MEVTSQLDLATTTSKEFAELALTVYEDVEVVRVTACAIAAKRANGKTVVNLILTQNERYSTLQQPCRLATGPCII